MSRVLPAAASMLLLLVIACGNGRSEATLGPDGSASPTPGSSSTATIDSVGSLREVDFSDPVIAGPLIDAAGGGSVPPERVEFHDLIGNDGIEEAVVVVESGGTLGDLGVGVVALIEGRPQLVQFIPAAGRVEVRQDLVVTIEGEWAASDPQCCPSQLHETSYQWDGARFVAITDQIVPNPD